MILPGWIYIYIYIFFFFEKFKILQINRRLIYMTFEFQDY